MEEKKLKIFNLIILDKSGSMSSISDAAISGFNETVGGIRSAQERYRDTQERKLFRAKRNREEKNYRSMDEFRDRIAPDNINTLKDNEIFVFGSNLAGMHAGGAARAAAQKFGAVMGQGVGLQGQSYAIPTMQGGVETIKPYVDEFIKFADCHPELTFLVTRIGCGIAGFTDKEIAPLFVQAINLPNVHLPLNFWKELVQD